MANTDPGWFDFLSRRQPLDEVNHWQPSGRREFSALNSGELSVFRLRLHALFDHHYVTITPDKVVNVSKRIKEEFENGRDYYAMHGKPIREPEKLDDRPSIEALRRHNDLFLG